MTFHRLQIARAVGSLPNHYPPPRRILGNIAILVTEKSFLAIRSTILRRHSVRCRCWMIGGLVREWPPGYLSLMQLLRGKCTRFPSENGGAMAIRRATG